MAGGGRVRDMALALSVVLAAVTGYVDAVGFASLLAVFPTNQSGNMVFLGMAIGGHGPTPGWRTATSIACFGIGATAGFVAGRKLGNRHHGPVLLGSELVMLLVVVAITGPIVVDHPTAWAHRVDGHHAHQPGDGGADRGHPARRGYRRHDDLRVRRAGPRR